LKISQSNLLFFFYGFEENFFTLHLMHKKMLIALPGKMIAKKFTCPYVESACQVSFLEANKLKENSTKAMFTLTYSK
jgi:hypothetical protein